MTDFCVEAASKETASTARLTSSTFIRAANSTILDAGYARVPWLTKRAENRTSSPYFLGQLAIDIRDYPI
ncbi:hypothetical protein SAMN05216386_0945 [Nitrosospira briensis]|uniref:Uncharacterized protein n=1 Tax=Nitrosospira briensis TaxID=35799 RepID=A0A1I4YYP4_9PROT|nr:hypothetical protein SAMN05216386_0945 [Nitrosospira briensis]